jgi:hypothetical protein
MARPSGLPKLARNSLKRVEKVPEKGSLRPASFPAGTHPRGRPHSSGIPALRRPAK